MSSKRNPKIDIGGNVDNSVVLNGDRNRIKITQQVAPKEFRDTGTFLPMGRNNLFTGRKAALAALTEALNNNTKVVITQAITGMGGIGKSQLALEFAYLSTDKFISAHWLNLADPSQLNAEIATCGRQMGLLNDEAKQPEMVAETLRVWGNRGPRLLVLDNYEAATDAMQTLAPLLQVPTLRLLITARHADFPLELGLQTYPLEVFTPEDSLKFLHKLVKLGDEYKPDLETLSEKLGHLPLALHLAGYYLREERITPAEYLRDLDEVLTHESMQATWFKEIGIASPTAHEQSLLATFALSWQKITDEQAQIIFKVAGYLAPNTPIPLEIFAAVLEVEEKDRGFKRALRQLEKIGLFTIKDGLPIVHPLLAAYGRYLHLHDEPNQLLENLTNHLITISTNRLKDQLPVYIATVAVHLTKVAVYAEKASLSTAGSLWNNYGSYLELIADYADARNAFEHALRIDEIILGPEHPYVAIRLSNLGSMLQDLGDLGGAYNMIEHALKIDVAVFGSQHPNVSRDLSNLGSVLLAIGISAARSAFERTMQIDEAIFGSEHLEVARDLNNIATVLINMGDVLGTLQMLKRALAILEKTLPPEHPYIANTINNLGAVFTQLGDLDSAFKASKRALQIDEAVFGLNHPKVATDVFNLGHVFQLKGKKRQARACYQRALLIYEQFLPAEHSDIMYLKKSLMSLDE